MSIFFYYTLTSSSFLKEFSEDKLLQVSPGSENVLCGIMVDKVECVPSACWPPFSFYQPMCVSTLFSLFSHPPEVPLNPPWFVLSWAQQQSYRVQQRCLTKFQHSNLVGQVQSVSDLPQVLHAAVLHINHLPLQRGADTQAQQLSQMAQMESSKLPISSSIKFVLSRLFHSEPKGHWSDLDVHFNSLFCYSLPVPVLISYLCTELLCKLLGIQEVPDVQFKAWNWTRTCPVLKSDSKN